MKHSVSRRTFMAGLAGVAAACGSTRDASNQVAVRGEQFPLNVRYTGLTFFQHDSRAGRMRVGLLDHNHKTVVIGRKDDVDIPGKDLKPDDVLSWNPIGLSSDTRQLTYWEGKKFSLSLTSIDPLKVAAPFGVFRLQALAMAPADLTAGNCQSLLSFQNGTFAGFDRPHVCDHHTAKWKMVKGESDEAPKMTDVALRDTVEHTVGISAGEFALDDSTVKFKSRDVRLWVMQVDARSKEEREEELDPKEIEHCKHYYDLVKDFSGDRYYPRRDSVPADCKFQADADPIYCTPGEQ
jgi:hypothetical protein